MGPAPECRGSAVSPADRCSRVFQLGGVSAATVFPLHLGQLALVDPACEWPVDQREAYRITAAIEKGSATAELFAEVQRT